MIIVLSIPLNSCVLKYGDFNEINELYFVTCIGVDMVPENEMYQISLQITHGIQKGGQHELESFVLTNVGKSIESALDNIQIHQDKKIFFGKTKYIILGPSIVKNKLSESLDVFTRKIPLAFNMHIFTLSSYNASEFFSLTTGKTYSTSNILSIFEKHSEKLLQEKTYDIAEVLNMFESQYHVALITNITLQQKQYDSKEKEDKYEILPLGYSVFKGKRMIGYLNKEQSLGVDWINNTEIKPSLVIDDKAFGKLTTKVDSFQTKLTPLIFEQESKKIIINVKFQSNIGEIITLYKDEITKQLKCVEDVQNKEVKEQIESALKFAIENQVDIFDFSHWQNCSYSLSGFYVYIIDNIYKDI